MGFVNLLGVDGFGDNLEGGGFDRLCSGGSWICSYVIERVLLVLFVLRMIGVMRKVQHHWFRLHGCRSSRAGDSGSERKGAGSSRARGGGHSICGNSNCGRRFGDISVLNLCGKAGCLRRGG